MSVLQQDGLVATEVCAVSEDYEAVDDRLRLLDGAWLAGLVESVHGDGGRVVLRLSAGRGRAIGVVDPDRAPVSASVVAHAVRPEVVCRALACQEIALIVHRFRQAGAVARAAGVDAVEIDARPGDLVDQFGSVQWNRRGDAYGGSAGNRGRFLAEIVEAAGESGLPVSVGR